MFAVSWCSRIRYRNRFLWMLPTGLFTPNDSVTGQAPPFDLFDGHCDGKSWLHIHFVRQRNVCYGDGDGVAWCE